MQQEGDMRPMICSIKRHSWRCLRHLVCLLSLAVPLMAGLGAGDALAAAPGSTGSEVTVEVTTPEQEEESSEFVDSSHEAISDYIEIAARELDLFFGGEEAAKEATGTYIRLRGWRFEEEGSKPELRQSVQVRLVLPKTQKRLRLEISRDDAEDSDNPDNTIPPNDLTDDNTVNDTLASLHAYLVDSSRWRARATAGVRVKVPPDVFAKGSVRRTDNFGLFLLRLEEELAWFESNGLRNTISMIWDIGLNNMHLLRSGSRARWTEEDSIWTYTQDIILFQSIGKRSGLAYRGGAEWESDPTWRLVQYSGDVSWRRDIYKGWVFVEFRPGVRWPQERGLQPVFGWLMLFETFFGNRGG